MKQPTSGRHNAVWILGGALLVLIALTLALQPSAPLSAAPQPIPTPITANFSPNASRVLTWVSSSAKTADGSSSALEVREIDGADIQWVVNISDTQAITLLLQYSNDNSNWVDGPAIASNVSTDANDMQQFALFGRWARIDWDVSTSAPVTVTVIGIGK